MKKAIAQTKPKIAISEPTADCACVNCDCDDCKCKPGFKCDCNGCKKLKGTAALVDRCWVIIDDVKMFTIEGVTAEKAMASIKAQGNKVVFIDSNSTVVDPPSWYSGKVAMKGSQPVQSFPIQPIPVQQMMMYQQMPRGFSAGMGFNNFSAGVCIGGG